MLQREISLLARYRLQVLGFTLVIVLDKLSKWWVVRNNFSFIVNRGGVFSVFDHWPFFGLLPILAFCLLSVVFLRVHKRLSRGEQVGFGLLFGGSISNLMDRVLWGGVVDFLHVFPQNWFNLADVAITGGIILVLFKSMGKVIG